MLVHEQITNRLRAEPDRLIVEYDGRQWSAAELDAAADRVSAAVQQHGSRAVVGVCMERSFELVAGLLGTLRAGASYLPLDPEDPKGRLGFVLEDAHPDVVLVQEKLRDRLSSDTACLVVETLPDARPDSVQLVGSDLAYVIYTSGSTGKPKGAMNTHAGLLNRLEWMQDLYPIDERDAVVQKTPFTFDVSVWEFFWPLMVGARLVVARPGGHRDPAYLADLIESSRVSAVHFVPSMLRLFLDEPRIAGRCSAVRHLFSSGEALTAELRDAVFERLPSTAFHNLYGPTEAAIDVTHWTCKATDRSEVVPIGFPVPNTAIHIIGDDGRPVGDGEVGELCIGGVQVARGYLNRPELTAERFIADPFGAPGARMYRTGDLARRRPDGAYEFLGRRDHQIKLRGFRVELGEIEAALSADPAIRQAVVVALGDRDNVRLIAYVVRANGSPLPRSAIRARLSEQLPEYMVPAIYVTLDRMPLTTSGKVDRAALPAPTQARPELEQPFVPPRTDLERTIVQLWRSVLELDEVGVNDRFFELGGTSIQAARIVTAVQAELGEFVYVTTIFEAPTVSEYAKLLQRDYPGAVAKRFGVAAGAAASSETVVDEAAVVRFMTTIPRFHQESESHAAARVRNPPAVFILAPPRSGTTLLRVMLAGHPQLFAAAELQLLGFRTMRERRAAFSGRYAVWLEGAVRAVMDLLSTDANGAEAFIADCEARDLTTMEFYGELQSRLKSRLLLDKSPQYALDAATLERAESEFDGARYIHLVRHPYATATSFATYHMDQVLFVRERPFRGRTMGELVWTASHRTVTEFLQKIPTERWVRIRFEDLVQNPRASLEQVCQAVGVPFHDAVLDPYADLDRKMTDGVHRESTPMGDTHFLERKRIDPSVADSWRGVLSDDFLGNPTWVLAEQLGYPRPSHGPEEIRETRRERLAARRARLGGGGAG